MGYYDPYPQVSLTRPHCLVGFMGSEVHHTTYFLSSMTGVPYVELDKRVEHEVGMSVAQLYLESGEERWRAVEADALARALRERPAPLICLGPSALLSEQSRALCLSSAELIYIRRPRDVLLDHIRRGRVETPGRFPYWAKQIPRSIDDLTPYLKTREPTYESAHRLLDAGDLSPLEVARRLMNRLGWDVESY